MASWGEQFAARQVAQEYTSLGRGWDDSVPGDVLGRGSDATTPHSYKSDEAKSVKKLAPAIIRRDFNAALFAFILMQEGPEEAERAFEIAMEIVRQMAVDFATGMTHTEKALEYGVQAARMLDGLNQFDVPRGKHKKVGE